LKSNSADSGLGLDLDRGSPTGSAKDGLSKNETTKVSNDQVGPPSSALSSRADVVTTERAKESGKEEHYEALPPASKLRTSSSGEEVEKHSSKEIDVGDSIIPPEKAVAVIDCKAWVHPRENGEVGLQFVVARKDIEDKSGIELKTGNAYILNVEVGEAFKFEWHRVISDDRYVHFYVPVKHLDVMKRGETYPLTFSLITEEARPVKRTSAPERLVSSGSLLDTEKKPLAFETSKAYRGSGEDPIVRFSVRKQRIERSSGIRFEKDGEYLISGRIANICRFEQSHREKGYTNALSVAAPKEYSSAFRIGEKYSIIVDSIEQKKIETGIVIGEKAYAWDWKTVAAWVDTEGSFQVYPNSNRAAIAQKERAPLEGIRAFLDEEGISSHIVVQHKKGEVYYQLGTNGGIEKLAEFVKNVEPYLVTRNKKDQVARLMEKLSEKPKHENVHRRGARDILGVP
jgi:hypothetical protein